MNPTKTIAQNRENVRRFLAGTHSGKAADLTIIDSTVSENILCHGFPGGNPVDRESYKQFFRSFGAAFSDMDFRLLSLITDEHHVAARWRITVTHSGPFAGRGATGRRVSVEGIAQYRLENGLIAETWLYMDELGLLQQIGVMEEAQLAS